MNYDPLWLLGGSIICACIPVVIGISTSYLKISVVLGLIRNALGTQNTPGSLIVVALSLALTIFIMGPTLEEIAAKAVTQKILSETGAFKQKQIEALINLAEPMREFLRRYAGDREKTLFLELRAENVATDPNSFIILIPAFMLTELKDSFRMGFVILLPFLIVDLVVANILAGLGMYMMSPAVITLPLKLILFVASDAWILLIQSLVLSYKV